MRANAESYGHAVILNIDGEITEDSLKTLQQIVDHQLENQDLVDLVLNMEKVPFIDSAALEYLLEVHDRLAERFGQVRLARPDENIRKILEITRLESTFEVFKDVPEAIKALQS